MKRIVILSLLLCMLTGCANEPSNDKCEDNIKENPNVAYSEGVFYDKSWDDHTGSYENNVIPDMETAITVASAIFDAMEKSSEGGALNGTAAAKKFTIDEICNALASVSLPIV